jgi:sulfatase maturation enzyme AslB (radical SAM superfamily)
MSLFCPIPWNMAAMRNNGDYRVCCHANISEDRGLIMKGPTAMNAAEYGPKEVRNSDQLKKMRSEMLAGKWPSACTRCKGEEDSGLKSRRLMEVSLMDEGFEQRAIQLTSTEGEINEIKLPLERLDLRLGNKCNLKCRMCGPTDSDAWYSDHLKLWGDKFTDTHGEVVIKKEQQGIRAVNGDYDWITKESFWKSLEADIEGLQYIHIVGGEPLIIEEHYKFLKICSERGLSKNITLEYNTNLTVLPEHVLELWSHFKEVKLGVSLDGVHGLNDYIRYPSRWEVIEANLSKLQQKKYSNITVWLSFSVQALNILNLVDVLRWKLKSSFHQMNGYFHKKVISTHPVHKPEHLSTQVFPVEIKKRIESILLSQLVSLKNEVREIEGISDNLRETYSKNLDEMFMGHISFMNREDHSREFNNFLKITKDLDELRGQSLESSVKELAKVLKEFGVKLS